MKHTPGPWNRIIADGYTVRHPQIYSDTGPVANATWLGDGRLDELNANARLIAAAPDLLKQRDELLIVLKQAHRFLRKNGYDMTDIDAIIAKVEDKS